MFTRILIVISLQAAIGFLVLPKIIAGDIDAQGLYKNTVSHVMVMTVQVKLI